MDLSIRTPALHYHWVGVGSSGCKAGPAWELENLTMWSREGEPQAGTSHTHLHWTSWAPGTWRGAFSTVLSQWQLWRDPCNSGNVPGTTGSSCCAAEEPVTRSDSSADAILSTGYFLFPTCLTPSLKQRVTTKHAACCPPAPLFTLASQGERRTSTSQSEGGQLRSPWLLVSLLAMGSNTAHAETICKSLSALEGTYPQQCLISVL